MSDERVQIAPAASRFTQCNEHPVRGKHGVVHALEVVVANRFALAAQDGDELVEETTLGRKSIGERIDR